MAQRPPRLAPVEDASDRQVALPKVPCDPLASLPATEILTTCAGRTWCIPPLTADRWLKILWTAPFEPDSIFPGLVEDESIDDILLDAYFAGELEVGETSQIAMEILEIASGYSFWFTLRLSAVFAAGWSRLGGMLEIAGVDARTMSLGAWCSAALEMCIGNMESARAAELINELLAAPEGVAVEVDPFDQHEDTAAFMEAMNTVF